MKRQRTVNFLGAIGYLLVLFSWLWAVILVLTSTTLLEKMTAEPAATGQATPTLPEFSLPEPVAMIFVALVTILMIGVSIYVFFKVPTAAVKHSSRIARKSATKLTPTVTRGKPTPKAQRRKLTARLLFYIKLALVVVPVVTTVGLMLVRSADMTLAPQLSLLLSALASLLAMLFFAAQYLLAPVLKIPTDKLV